MNIYWSLQEQKLMPSLNSTAQITQFNFVLRDTIPVVLRVCNTQSVQNVPYVVTAIDAGKSIKFGAKALATYATDAEFLFSQATWTAAGSGTTTTYTANINLNTAELIAAIGTAAYLDCKAEFTILNASNENELSTQVTFRILKDVVTGSEGVPTSEFQVIAQYTDESNVQSVRIVNAAGVAVGLFKNGAPYVFIQSTGLWYPLTGVIQDGIPVPALGAGESI
jgi:hypothetical protein